MLYFYLSKIREHRIIEKINAFLYTPWYMLSIALIMAASNLFGWEFFAFYAYMLIGVYMVLFAPDCFPAMIMFCCGYMLFSIGNNPAANYGETIFSKGNNLAHFIVLASIIGVSLLVRLFFEIFVVRRKIKRMPALTLGFVALGAAYLLSGAFTKGYGGKELLYAALQILSLCITYFYFYYTVDWKARSVSDGAMMLTFVGVGLFLEIIGMYLHANVIEAIKNGTFIRDMLLSGWGVYNNVGGMMAMLMPAPFYFACTKEKGWRYLILASVFFCGVILTQSRGAILAASLIYALGWLVLFLYMPKERRKETIRFFVVMLVGLLVVGFIILINILAQVGVQGNGRMDIYKVGWQQFLESPIFGKGFYAPYEDREKYATLLGHQHGWQNIGENYFIPPRYHNTIVQLLASGGIVALVAYGFHRLQTLLLFLRKPTVHKIFLGLAIGTHLLASLLDCHFFNLGPGLTYGIILLFAEMLPSKQKEALPAVDKFCEGT